MLIDSKRMSRGGEDKFVKITNTSILFIPLQVFSYSSIVNVIMRITKTWNVCLFKEGMMISFVDINKFRGNHHIQ